jgi:neutral ceramidase
MPLPSDIRREVSKVTGEARLWVQSDEGRRERELMNGFAGWAVEGYEMKPEVAREAAKQVLGWAERLPERLIGHDEAPWLGSEKTSERSLRTQFAESLLALDVQARALLTVGSAEPKAVALKAMHLAFGADTASAALRKDLLGRRHPGLPQINPTLPPEIREVFNNERLREIVLAGSLTDLMQAFAQCGLANQAQQDWVAQVQPFGQVTSMKPARACAGQTLRVQFSGFGNAPPDPATVADVMIALPTTGTCRHISLRGLVPAMFLPGGWSDSGFIDVLLPDDVYTGTVGFFSVPPPMANDFGCDAGRVSGAAGMWQSLMGQYFGAAGVLSSQSLVDVAQNHEAHRHLPLPCATLQADGANLLQAGPPRIHQFHSDEIWPIHPRGKLTLRWATTNATHVEIVAVDVPGTENPHELPAIANPQPASGSLVLNIPCTRRWEGRYILVAHNANGCAAQPVQAELTLRSGFSHYRLGVAKSDVTYYQRGVPMAGFAYERQLTDGVAMPLYARAFSIQENQLDGRCLTLVVVDIWTCTQIVKREVLKRLNFGVAKKDWHYTDENLLIAGTHTHSGPGGYSEYHLYNFSIGGFDQDVFDAIVRGIVQAVQSANLNARPGRLFVNAGDVENCGAQRSWEAFKLNPEFDANDPGSWTDREMLLFGFWEDTDNRSGRKPMGLLNWYAFHPTSLGMFNNQVSGDNKGHAEELAEMHFDGKNGLRGSFVAAFGNASAGDVSGSMSIDASGNKTVNRPMGGDVPAAPVTFPLPPPRHPSNRAQDLQRMELLGQCQFERARDLFDTAQQEVTGPLRCGHLWVDMSAVSIADRPGARTSTAALGVSFGAGSSEDSIAFVTEGPVDFDVAIIEGMNNAEMTASGIAFWASAALLLGPRLPLFVAALASPATMVPAVASTLLLEIAILVLIPGARSYAAAKVGALVFLSAVTDKAPQCEPAQGSWEWLPPPVPSAALMAAHGDKPIMFDVGNWQLRFNPGPQARRGGGDEACPLVPHVLPMQLLDIGGVAIAGVPAEFNSMAGLRLKQSLRDAFGNSLSHVAIAGYCNGYSSYVSTREEYTAQHYEGASTLYGPATLEAYQQSFVELARRVQGLPSAALSGEQTEGFVAPAIYHRT